MIVIGLRDAKIPDFRRLPGFKHAAPFRRTAEIPLDRPGAKAVSPAAGHLSPTRGAHL